MGQDGFRALASSVMATTLTLRAAVTAIPGLVVMGVPCMTAFAIQSSDPTVDILAVADAMEAMGWKMERQQLPSSIHFSVCFAVLGLSFLLPTSFLLIYYSINLFIFSPCSVLTHSLLTLHFLLDDATTRQHRGAPSRRSQDGR